MKSASRWPLHPAPIEGEALSSWLYRVASCYQMDTLSLLKNDLGYDRIDDLDTDPPLSLLIALSKRSGIVLDRLRCMSFAGWVPWLLDSLDDSIPSALETYTFQFSVLLQKRNHNKRMITRWCAWLPRQPIHRACPLCLHMPAKQAILLVWKLPLMLSCPLHGCWLEPCWDASGEFFRWENTDAAPRMANDAILAMDRRTWQALAMGYVEMPRRRIHAAIWFRLLRTLLDELNTPLSRCGACSEDFRYIWKSCNYPLRAGQHIWRPYEILDLAVQLRFLEATATAINLIEANVLKPRGEQAELFLPKPQTNFTNGLPSSKRRQNLDPCWKEMFKMIDETVAEAQHNPEAARFLFALASYGQQDPASLEHLRTLFSEQGIPTEFLSHYIPDRSFMCLRINDDLSDKI